MAFAGQITSEDLRKIEALYQRGQMLRAWEAAQAFGGLHTWESIDGRLMAGRLATMLGNGRLGRVIHRRAWKQSPRHFDAASYRAYWLLEQRGHYAAWKYCNAFDEAQGEGGEDARMHWFTVRAAISAEFRDFDTAEIYMRRARELNTAGAWLHVCQSRLYEKQDRYDEALAEARKSVGEIDTYRPGVTQLAHALRVCDRNTEALEFLRAANARMQCGAVAWQLGQLEMDLGYYQDALAHFEEHFAVSPLADKRARTWLQREHISAACATGDIATARRLASDMKEPYYEDLVKRIDTEGESRARVRLDVGFVRQHDMTCGPATLTALCGYWGRQVSHLEVVDQICYDGTTHYNERSWVEKNGFAVKEFSVTWNAAVALLNAGIPFTLTTVEATSAHLQGVIGYDALRRTLFIRDPFVYSVIEVYAPEFLDRYKGSGPRGMAFLPMEKKELLEAVELPDTAPYDLLHRIGGALEVHQRGNAQSVFTEMERVFPGHRLTLLAGRMIAGYDANTHGIRLHVDQMLGLYPEDGRLLVEKFNCMTEQETRTERMDFLVSMVGRKSSPPVFKGKLANELRAEAARWPAAVGWIKDALRRLGTDPESLTTLASILWDQRHFEEATAIYRLAACTATRVEGCSRSYFIAARYVGQAEQALEFLRHRVKVHGAQSPLPAFSLFDALVMLERVEEAFRVLAQAQTAHPDDGQLLQFAADAHARFGNVAKAEELLAKLEGKVRRGGWLRSAAHVAAYKAERRLALEYWREILSIEPLSVDAVRSVAWLVAETEGAKAARAFLAGYVGRFSNHCGVLAVNVEFARSEGAAAMETALRHLLAANPADAWARRELAIQLQGQGRAEEALAMAMEAIGKAPNDSFGYSTRGQVLLALGRKSEAREDFGKAVHLLVDNTYAMEKLLDACDTHEERGAAIKLIEDSLVNQVIVGEALLCFRTSARGVLIPPAVLSRLREAVAARPDLWSAWSALIHQLLDMNQLDEALKTAREAVARFPFICRLGLDLARVQQVNEDVYGQINAIEAVLAVNPGFGEASRELSDAYMRAGNPNKARQVLEAACVQSPLDVINHGALADVLWRTGERAAAVERVTRALKLEPGYTWAWQMFLEWKSEPGNNDLAISLAKDLVERRPGEIRSWMRLAECMVGTNVEEALAAANHALKLAPQSVDARDLKARILVRADRVDEAIAVCRNSGITPQPVPLRVREAWIEQQHGRLDRAIKLLEEVVKEHPSYYGAWQFLADWQEQAGAMDKAVQAADHMALLAPHDAVPLGYGAELCLKRGDEAGALKRFQKAFKLDHRYDFAYLNLFDLHLRRSELNEAGEVLARIKTPAFNEWIVAREIQLLARRDARDDALKLFDILCRTKNSGSWALNSSLGALDKKKWKKKADKIIDRALKDNTSNIFLGAIRIGRRFNRGKHKPTRADHELFRKGEEGRIALAAYLDSVGSLYSQATAKNDLTIPFSLKRYFKRLTDRHRDIMLADDDLWGKAAYILVTMKDYAGVVRWTQDWGTRKGVQAWMLYNLVLSLESLKRYDEASVVISSAMQRRMDPSLYASFAILMALETAMRGSLNEAKSLLSTVSKINLEPIEKALHGLAEFLVNTGKVGIPERKTAIKTHWMDLVASFSEIRIGDFHPIVRNNYKRVTQTVASWEGYSSLKWRAWWHAADLRLPVFILTLPFLVVGVVASPALFVGALAVLFSNIWRSSRS